MQLVKICCFVYFYQYDYPPFRPVEKVHCYKSDSKMIISLLLPRISLNKSTERFTDLG